MSIVDFFLGIGVGAFMAWIWCLETTKRKCVECRAWREGIKRAKAALLDARTGHLK